MTRQRAVVLEVLRMDKSHHTAEEIYELAKAKLPSISRATVYNNLHALEKECFIRRISRDSGYPDRYDNAYIPHGHLLCTECGGVYDVDVGVIEETLQNIAGDVPLSYELKLYAKCDKCKNLGK